MNRSKKDNIISALVLTFIIAGGVIFFKNNMPDKTDSSLEVTPVETKIITEAPVMTEEEIQTEEVTEAPAETEVTVPETTIPVTEQSPAADKNLSEADKKAAELLAQMSLEEKVYQLFIAKPEQLSPDEAFLHEYPNTVDELKKYPVGGLIYFEDNLVSKEQCEEMLKNVQSRTKTKLFISVDEEGGEVARVGSNPDMGTTSFPDTGTIGSSGNAEDAYNEGKTIGSD